MKEKLILPFDDSHMLFNHCMGFPHAIIKACSGEHYDIIISDKYLNCHFKNTEDNYHFYLGTEKYWFDSKKIFINQHMRFLKENITRVSEYLSNIIINALLSGLYIMGNASIEYIGLTNSNDEGTYSYIITGYDYNNNTLIVNGVDSDHDYFVREIEIKQFIRSLTAVPDKFIFFYFCQYNYETQSSMDIGEIKNELADYIESKSRNSSKSTNTYFGLEAVNLLKQTLKMNTKETNKMKNCYLQGFLEHKFFINKTVNLLINMNYLDESFSDYSLLAYQIAQKCLDVSFKSKELTSEEIMFISKSIDDIISIEKEYIPQIIGCLKCY